MKKVMLILALFVLISGCNRDKTPTSPVGESSFAISLLQDQSLGLQQVIDKPVNTLLLDNQALITQNDIAFYDYSAHCIYLKKTKAEILTGKIDINNILVQPFVVQAMEKQLYLGSFVSLASSLMPCTPFIDPSSLNYFPDDIIHIAKSWPDDVDVRYQTEIEQSLKMLNKLHYGLAVSLSDIQIVNNTDTAAVQYSFTLKNNDSDALYVLDPDKMGSDLFHYFTNGIDFQGDDCYYYSEFKQIERPEPYDSWQADWFTLLAPGQAMERTLLLKGYPHIPAGVYSCNFRFSNPTRIAKQQRYTATGRYWIGGITSPDERVVVE